MKRKYRKITHLDVDMAPQVLELFRQSWWADKRTIEGTRSVLKGSDLTMGYLDEKQKLAAFARVITDGCYKATIYDVIVHREYQKEGLGRDLINDIVKDKLILDVRHIELYCLESMVPFYIDLGFAPIIPKVNLLRKTQIDKRYV